MTSVFVLQHLHVITPGEENVKFIGVYRTLATATAAVERLRLQPGFHDHPEIIGTNSPDDQGFHIVEYELDVDNWTEGYVTA